MAVLAADGTPVDGGSGGGGGSTGRRRKGGKRGKGGGAAVGRGEPPQAPAPAAPAAEVLTGASVAQLLGSGQSLVPQVGLIHSQAALQARIHTRMQGVRVTAAALPPLL